MTNIGLGIIPAWQFSMDPSVNPKINPAVKFPAGVYQTTVQPLGPYYQGGQGLGRAKSGGVKLLGLFGPKVQLLGVSDTVSTIGSFLVLALAAYGGWTVFKKVTK